MSTEYGYKDSIIEHNEVVQQHEFEIRGVEKTLRIKVLRMDDGLFMGVANLEVQGKDQASPYRSLCPKRTEKEAVNDALHGFFAFYSYEAKVYEVKDW